MLNLSPGNKERDYQHFPNVLCNGIKRPANEFESFIMNDVTIEGK